MRAEIVSVGTELLLGEISDTNAAYLAGELAVLGIDLYWITQVGDNQGRLVETLRRAWERSDMIITTGGLGPTEDDLTREAIAEMLREEIAINPSLEEEIRYFFSELGREMSPNNAKQAGIIPSARPIRNPLGTAPGWWVERDGRMLVALPGVPLEMRYLWEEVVAPELRDRQRRTLILSRVLKVAGMAEATVDERVGLLLRSRNPTLATYAKRDGTHLRLTAKGDGQDEVENALTRMEKSLCSLLGTSIWGSDDDTLEAVVGKLLVEKSLTLATMESCTGGLLASTITDAPGSSACFKGGLISYSEEMKIAWGVEPTLVRQYGTVSPQVAASMADAARRRLHADIGLGVTGVAGPSEVEGKALGTVHIALASDSDNRKASSQYLPDRQNVKQRATLEALHLLRRMLLDLG